jgi:putative flippase GtrA
MDDRLQTLITPTDSGFHQMVRFGMAGAVSAVADTGTLYILAEIAKMYYLYAGIFGYLVGIIVSYSISIAWVFPHRNIKDRRLEFAVFAVIGIGAMALTELILYAGVDIIHMNLILAKILSIGLVFFYNFGVRKAIMFRKPSKSAI